MDGHFPNKVRLWDVERGRTMGDIDLEFGGFNLDPFRVLFSPDGRYLAAIGEGRPRMALFDVKTRKLVWQGDLYGKTLAFSPDGRLVVGGSRGLILDGKTGEVLQALVSTFSEGSGAAQFYFSPDGTKLYMIGKDGLIWVWGVPMGP